jgi:hypothetical protein
MFKTWFVVLILRFQKWFDVDILLFQFGPCYRYVYIFFCLDTFWATFWNIGQIFSKTFSHPDWLVGRLVSMLGGRKTLRQAGKLTDRLLTSYQTSRWRHKRFKFGFSCTWHFDVFTSKSLKNNIIYFYQTRGQCNKTFLSLMLRQNKLECFTLLRLVACFIKMLWL